MHRENANMNNIYCNLCLSVLALLHGVCYPCGEVTSLINVLFEPDPKTLKINMNLNLKIEYEFDYDYI